MKTSINKYFVTCLLMIISHNLKAGCLKIFKDTTKTDTSKIAKIESKLDEILSRINRSKDDKEPVAILGLSQTPIYIYNQSGKTDDTIKIDKVIILIQDGFILDIQVLANNKRYTNTSSPIALKSKRFLSEDHLVYSKFSNDYIILQEVLQLISFRPYLPDDNLLNLSYTHIADTLYRNVGVNTVLDARVYTDALSAFGNAPNGLIQTDLKFKQITNRNNIKNKPIIWCNYLKFNFSASKFDSKNSFVDSAAFSRMALLQRSKISAEMALNLFTVWIENKSLSRAYIDFGAGINSGSVARGKDTVSVISRNIFLEAGVDLKLSSNIGFDAYGRIIWQTSKSTDSTLLGKTNMEQDDSRRFFKLGGEVYWNPFNDVANRVYARLNYYFTNEQSDYKNDFFQVQLGYSVLLSKLLGGK